MFARIAAKEAKPLVLEHHYLHTFPALPVFCFGWVEHERVTAVCIFGFSANRHYGPKALELQRLVRGPEYTGGQLTQFLAACFKYIRKDARDTSFIFSYADSGAGHHGGVYQAFNGLYLGTCPGQALYLHVPSGTLVSRRNKCHDQKRHGAKTADYVKQAKPAVKHLYAWPIRAKEAAVLTVTRRTVLLYPKPKS